MNHCEGENCNTCRLARKRGLDQVKALYTSNNEHYKLTSPGKWELFDIKSDLYQTSNIADENPETVKKMSEHYEQWWAKVETRMKERLVE